MKQLLVICVLALQLFGPRSANAGAVGQGSTETTTKKSAVISLFIQQEHPADLSQSLRLATTALKARFHRIPGTIVSFGNPLNGLTIPQVKQPDNYASPLYLPLIRLLLYPKHYFW